jgi:Transposase DDE domain group 1
VEHTKEELVAQRVYAMALGYEDLNDHDNLRHDPMLAVLVGKEDPSGESRARERDRGKALAGKSTLNRLELNKGKLEENERYKKIVLDEKAVEKVLVEIFLDAYEEAPKRIVLDLDATDDLIHGKQEGRFFHGYYGNYCYLPLYMFAGEHLLVAKLRKSDIDGSAGSVEELERVIGQIRERWPAVEILVRGDSGFCRDELMTWCESKKVDYLFGLAKNARLKKEIEEEMGEAKAEYERTRKEARRFKDFRYKTLESWSCERRVVGKAEHLAKGENPRFVVTSLKKEEYDAKVLYEKEYCGRGEMENRIKEQQLDLFADRTSAATMKANQMRLWFSSIAYVLMSELRRIGLKGTEMERAQSGTIRTRLLKIGAQVKISVRRVMIGMASGCPYANIFEQALVNLQQMAPI